MIQKKPITDIRFNGSNNTHDEINKKTKSNNNIIYRDKQLMKIRLGKYNKSVYLRSVRACCSAHEHDVIFYTG